MNIWITLAVIAIVAVAGFAVVKAVSADNLEVQNKASCSADGYICPSGGCNAQISCGYEDCAAKKGLACNCKG